MNYKISYTNPSSHFIDICLTIENIQEEQLSLQLPSWRPGRYELQDFAKNIFSIKAFGAKEQIPLQQLSKDKWLVDCAGTDTLNIHYRYYANQMDGGGTYVDEHQLYINWITCAFLVEGREQESVDIALELPNDYEIACALPSQQHSLKAQSFEELVDSPLIASNCLQHQSYEEGNCLFHIWIQGECQPDWDRILADFQAFTKVQIEAFGSFPTKEYHFLLQILPYRHYHGVEHKHSTVVVLGPSEDLMGKLYDDLLGVSSHELYHTWNVTRLRPKEMVPYQWHTYNYFHTGFVAEGVTTYYGDLMLARSGVWDAEAYLKELNVFLKRHFENFARHTASLADSSFELWLDGYSPRQPKRKVSIYVKGALVALLLDWKIRRHSQGAKSLDDLMNEMWSKYAVEGYSLENYQTLVEQFIGKEASDNYFKDCIWGTTDLMPLLAEEAGYMGLVWEAKEADAVCERKYGFRLQKSKVASIAPNSPAEEHLSIGDELIAINQRRVVNDNAEQLLNQHEGVELSLFRNNILENKRLMVREGDTFFKTYKLVINQEGNEEQTERLNQWLGQASS